MCDRSRCRPYCLSCMPSGTPRRTCAVSIDCSAIVDSTRSSRPTCSPRSPTRAGARRASQMHHRCIADASHMHRRCITDASQMHHRCITEALQMSPAELEQVGAHPRHRAPSRYHLGRHHHHNCCCCCCYCCCVLVVVVLLQILTLTILLAVNPGGP